MEGGNPMPYYMPGESLVVYVKPAKVEDTIVTCLRKEMLVATVIGIDNRWSYNPKRTVVYKFDSYALERVVTDDIAPNMEAALKLFFPRYERDIASLALQEASAKVSAKADIYKDIVRKISENPEVYEELKPLFVAQEKYNKKRSK